MTLGDIWGPRLAQAVAPEEKELAAIYVDAFIEGGQSRRDLFAPGVGEAGGFATGDTLTIIAPVLYAISVTAPLLNAMLVSPQIASITGIVNTATNVLKFRSTADRQPDMTSAADTPVADEAAPDAASGPVAPAANHPDVLRRVIDSMESELQRQGMSEAQSGLVTLRVIRELLNDPDESHEFVNALSSGATT